MNILILNIPALILFSIAAFLIWNDKDGCGWIVFAGLILIHVVRNDDKK